MTSKGNEEKEGERERERERKRKRKREFRVDEITPMCGCPLPICEAMDGVFNGPLITIK